ncbi:MAG: J domain-containing protein [Desulfobulbaceae bacterium]|nr:J domain-containing protein [Desulfobulbaceae bacterium]MCK5436705.1 J domain-containing protein [Desulfobulbaceae bacterium]MCK5544098.1 J domain-containing protein [Desulfobulbaceae bacterium]
MTEWKKIVAAKDLLGLDDRADLSEIKQAYRRMSKKYHPDVSDRNDETREDNIEMHELTEAYQTLIKYCSEYRFPLTPGEDEPLEGEDWWMDRFGYDPFWGKKRSEKTK